MPFSFLLRQWLWWPIEQVLSFFNALKNIKRATPQQRAMLLGAPSFLLFSIGLLVVGFGAMGQENRLVKKYTSLASQTRDKFQTQFREFQEIVQRQQGAQGTQNSNLNNPDAPNEPTPANPASADPATSDPATPVEANAESSTTGSANGNEEKINSLREELQALRRDEQIYRLKLVSLQPMNEEYKYEYALAFNHIDQPKMFQLIRGMAPEDRPGYPKAQLVIALEYYKRASTEARDSAQYLNKAMIHAENCLNLDKNNTSALDIKANALLQLGRTNEAYGVFKTLFDNNPHYFPRLISINRTLQRSQQNNEIYVSAQNRLYQMILNQRDNTAAWSLAWRSYVNCLLEQNMLDKIREEIQAEIKLNADRSDFEVRKQELDRYLALSAIREARRLTPSRNEDFEKFKEDFAKILTLLTEAANLDPNSLELKRDAANLYLFYPVDQAEFAKIYDPYADPNPPAFIYDLLGTKALEKSNFSEAITYLEKARAAEPDNPNVLNNLAWAYLSGTNTDPNRALFLSNLAISNLQKLPNARDAETNSHFLHTRGTAYLRLQRYVEAQADLSRALDGRPNHISTLQSLITCSDATGDKVQSDVYRMRLEELMAAQNTGSDSK